VEVPVGIKTQGKHTFVVASILPLANTRVLAEQHNAATTKY
jgi:hypothetical protein